jgi:hemolysin III
VNAGSISVYSRAEERLNIAMHAIGLVAGVAGLVALLLAATATGDLRRICGALSFGGAAVLLFGTSTLYHSTHDPQRRVLFRRLDHSAIYLLIAGTYTPFTLVALRGVWGWTMFALIWGIALFGIVAKSTSIGFRYPRISTWLYVGMGWMIVPAGKRLFDTLTTAEFTWLAVGGLLYTAGVPFYMWKSRPYTHALWHFFVLGGVICHFIAVYSLVSRQAI